ncbi:MAG: hypothetical protein NUV51_08120 [Sulfuricaulis sp.]|nr:hypothetical protein [Sulfuricaulis sp.]
MKHTFIILGAISLAIVGCASSFNQKEYDDLAAQAENEIKLAAKTGFLWANSEKFLKESKEAMEAATKAGDRASRVKESDKAMKLAKKALQEAKLAQQQAKDNANPDTKIP